ncbi:MAG: ATP-dependent RNA helicase HrpA [Chitinivibrionales bacterium]|nr:ATP-dependent RNA helicase HrpA [Chitinivibrionales bacterium]
MSAPIVHKPIFSVRTDTHLPIHEKASDIIESIQHHQVSVVAGETGSGKTTQLPLLCIQAGLGRTGKIVCTQPRRIAAVSLAQHVASLTGGKPGEKTGYKVRFQDSLSDETRIVFATDGIVLAEIAADPMLARYDAIIIDEAHERSLNIDFLLGYLRTLLPRRPELKVIISSATLDTQLFSSSFFHAPVIFVSGRMYPVEIEYRPLIEMWEGESMDSYLSGVVAVAGEVLDKSHAGDVLIFLPTVNDIIETVNALSAKLPHERVDILPLYSRLPIARQRQIYEPSGKRKVIVSTNIAETSLTVPGIKYVIDTGLARMSRYEPGIGVTRMPVERVARSSCDQRAGRCGRVQDGVCIRLFSERDYLARPAFTAAEIKRANLAGVILKMSAMNLGKVARFPFLQRPSMKAINDGFTQLNDLGAMKNKGHVTGLGRKMSRFPLDPRISRMLLYAQRQHALREIMIIAAALSISDPRIEHGAGANGSPGLKRRFRHPKSDLMTYVKIWDALPSRAGAHPGVAGLLQFSEDNGLSFHRLREWIEVYNQIYRICKRMHGFRIDTKPATYRAIHKCLLCGFARNIARLQSNGLYRGVREHDIAVFPGSVLFKKSPQWVLFHEIVETKRLFGRTVAEIEPLWIEELFARECVYACDQPYFDSERGEVRGTLQVSYRGLQLAKNRPIDFSKVYPQKAHEIFIEEALVKERIAGSYEFMVHNRQSKDFVLAAERKLRSATYFVGDAVMFDLYHERLPKVKSVRELESQMKKQASSALTFDVDELLAKPLPEQVCAGYPDEVLVGDYRLPVVYVFDARSEHDGATITIPHSLFRSVPLYYWEWLLPAYWKERVRRVAGFLRPRLDEAGIDERKLTDDLLSDLRIGPASFIEAVINRIEKLTSLAMRDRSVPAHLIAPHLWIKVQVVDQRGLIIDSFRPPIQSPEQPAPHSGKRASIWQSYCSRFEKSGDAVWDLPLLQRIEIASPRQLLPIPAWCACTGNRGEVTSAVFFAKAAAEFAHAHAVQRLLEQDLAATLSWEIESVKPDRTTAESWSHLFPGRNLIEWMQQLYITSITALEEHLPLDRQHYVQLKSNADAKIYSRKEMVRDLFRRCVVLYKECRELIARMLQATITDYFSAVRDELLNDLDAYLQRLDVSHAPASLSFATGLPRYLAAFRHRIEAGFMHPGKYRQAKSKLAAFLRELQALRRLQTSAGFAFAQKVDEFELMIEEYAVSAYAQHAMKTKMTVSEQRLGEKVRELRKAGITLHTQNSRPV